MASGSKEKNEIITDHNVEYGNFELIETTIHTERENENTPRFKKISDEDINKFLDEQANQNTKKKTNGDIKLFHKYLVSKGDNRLIETIPSVQLNLLISEFLLSVRKGDGNEYEPSTLRSFFSSFDRHLREKQYGLSILKDLVFDKCRQVLKMKQQDLKKKGKGNKPHAADPITDKDIETMYASKTLGDSSPQSIINSLWMICTIQFGMRTGQEVHDLMWGDITLNIDDANGDEYIQYNQERQTKTRTGANPRDVRLTKPRAYAIPENKDKDPVHIYKIYQMRRPQEMLEPESPFFLTASSRNPKPGQLWFKRQPMGINKLYAIMKNIKDEAGLTETDKRITPYSARKHLVQKLNDAGVAPNQIIQISGHKNVNSLNNYSRLNPEQSKQISHILANKQTVNSPIVPLPNSKIHEPQSMFANLPMPQASDNFFANSIFNGTVNITFQNKSEHQTLTQTQTASYTSSSITQNESSSP